MGEAGTGYGTEKGRRGRRLVELGRLGRVGSVWLVGVGCGRR